MSGALAAIDCGTNSTRLLVESPDGIVLAREMRITRLGQGVDATGVLADEAIERTLSVLAHYRGIMDAHDVVAGRLAATSAARDAGNGAAFLEAASALTGVEAEILSGIEEGRLSFAGATTGLTPVEGWDLVLDIGGGSTEIVVAHDGGIAAHSMQVGCVRVSERTLHGDPPTPAEFAMAEAMVAAALDGAFAALPELADVPARSRMVGLAGTVATLAMVDQNLAVYDREAVHHHWLSLEAIRSWRDVLAAETIAARSRRPGMVEGREDVIVGGLIVLAATLDRLGLDGCLTSESDILDGLVASLRGR